MMIPKNFRYQETVKHIITGAPFIQYLGMELKELEPGICETIIPIKTHHLQQDNFIHAGVLATMADHTAGMASLSLVPEHHVVLTIEFKVNFLRPATGELLRCKAKVLKYGKTIIVAESEVFMANSGAEKLVAKATVTLANVNQNSLANGAMME